MTMDAAAAITERIKDLQNFSSSKFVELLDCFEHEMMK